MIATPTNEFLDRLDRTLDWQSLEKALQAMYPATTGRPPCAPLVLAYWSKSPERVVWPHKVANGILRKPSRGQKLRPAKVLVNRLFSSIRCKIEKVFGWWKRSAGYRQVRCLGQARNRLELE